MSLADLYSDDRVALSFELFPPKSEEGVQTLLTAVDELMKFSPAYFTCTYGAGGSTQDRTLQVATAVLQKTGKPVASHLTCVNATIEDLRGYLTRARAAGVQYIVALRGDPPKGETQFRMTEGGLRYANELVELIRGEFADLDIAVAGYPEVHQEAVDADADLANLKRKVDAGGSIVITQLFYQNEDFFRFRDRCHAAGIDVPIVPGIMPVTNLGQIQRITSMCKAALPNSFVSRLGEREDAAWQFDVGVDFARKQVQGLLESGIPGLHFYVLNKSQATAAVLEVIDPFSSC